MIKVLFNVDFSCIFYIYFYIRLINFFLMRHFKWLGVTLFLSKLKAVSSTRTSI